MEDKDKTERLAIDGGTPVRTAPWPPRHLFGGEEKAAAAVLFDAAIASGNAFGYNGPEEEAYCREFAEYMGGGFSDAVNSGTAAMYVALRALDLEPFTEVIVPPVTDMGGVMPVPLMNCIPICADSRPDSYNVGPEQIEARLTERTSAIVVAHISGHVVDMDPIIEMARARGIPVLEDCAQAHGATYKGRLAGTIGDIAAFSTMFGKHHATGGQGGVVYTRREDLYWRARQASDRGKPFGIEGGASNVLCSLNLNLNDLSAAIGRAQLKKLPAILAGCRRVAHEVYNACQGLHAVRMDMGLPGCQGAYWFAVFRLDWNLLQGDIQQFTRALQAEGIPCMAPYTRPFVQEEWYKNRAVFGHSGFPWTSPLYKGDPDAVYPLPNVERVHDSHFMLKIHETMGPQDVADIAQALRKVERACPRK